MSMISNGLAWLQSQLVASAGTAIIYHAGPIAIEIPDAVHGKSEYETHDAAGVVVRAISTDWLIAPARLTSSGEPVEPSPGHRIEHTEAGVTRWYEVQPLGGVMCWRWSGPSHDRLRIHVREIAAIT